MPRGGDQGIRVPEDPNCLYRYYHDSSIIEFYATEALREERVSQLRAAQRYPLRSFDHDTGTWGRLKDVWGVRWTEPRGEELDAIRTSS